MKRYMLPALALAAVSTPALAQRDRIFTGPRVEGVVGYEKLSVPFFKDPDGFVYGIGIGYDFAAGGLLIGIDADITDSTSKVTVAGPNIATGRDLYAGARIGRIVAERTLVYVKGGYTNARFSSSSFGGDTFNGFRLGLGVEHALSEKTFVKAEYRYSNYQGDVSRNQAMAGFGIRF